MTMEGLFPPDGITGLIALILMAGFWLSSTIAILCIMEVGFYFSLILIGEPPSNRGSRVGFICILARTPVALGGGEQQTLHGRGIREFSVVYACAL